MRIGLFGGTFDPVHHGHLWIAEAARAEYNLREIIWVPAGDPPHKQGVILAPQEHRYAMVLLATATNPAFTVSRHELDRPGPSYSIDTIQHYRREFPNAEIYFVIGADSALELLTWYRHSEVVVAARIVAVHRPGFDLSSISKLLPSDYVARIQTLEVPGLELSGTDIRECLRRNRTVRYMVPEAVESYLRKHRLYDEDPADAPNQLRVSGSSRYNPPCGTRFCEHEC